MFSRTFFKSGMEDEVCCAIFNAHAGVKGRQHRGYVLGHFVDNVAAQEVQFVIEKCAREIVRWEGRLQVGEDIGVDDFVVEPATSRMISAEPAKCMQRDLVIVEKAITGHVGQEYSFGH